MVAAFGMGSSFMVAVPAVMPRSSADPCAGASGTNPDSTLSVTLIGTLIGTLSASLCTSLMTRSGARATIVPA